MKRVYHALALIAIINLFAVGGLVGYLFASGRLNEERVNQIGEVLRGEYPVKEEPTTQPAAVAEKPLQSREEIAAVQAKREFYQLVGARHEREMVDRKALNESIQLQVLRRLEDIEQKSEQFQQQKTAFEAESEQEGFTQALEMYSAMDPKLAKDLLRTREKDADVVRLLVQMDSNKRKKIINACKAQEERVWIGRILNQVQKLDNP